MTERDKAVGESCSVDACDAAVTEQCLRCGGHHCDDHAPGSDQRCEACETDFREAAARLDPPADRFVLWAALAIVAAFIVNWLLLTFTPIKEWLALVAGSCVFVGVAAVYMVVLHPDDEHRRKVEALRRDFLAEHRSD